MERVKKNQSSNIQMHLCISMIFKRYLELSSKLAKKLN